VVLLAGTFGLFLWERANGASIEHARTVAVNALVMFEIFYLFTTRYLTDSVFSLKGFFGNSYATVAAGTVVIFQLIFTYFPPMQALFETEAIGFAMWVRVIMVAASVLFLVELEKYVLRKRRPAGSRA
jgi:magnesium-transporting ATPase (P-type)